MGNLVDTIVEARKGTILCPLLQLPISRVREFYGKYKNTCDDFSVNHTEFELIFMEGDDSFKIWDTENTGYVLSLEVFAGLVIFAASKSEDKIRLLFDIFDFNNIKAISIQDLEFCIDCIVETTYKLYNL
jgi:hypothetical protein